MAGPVNRNLRGLGLAFNLPTSQQPQPLSPLLPQQQQEQQHTFDYDPLRNDDGYYYDAGTEQFGEEDAYYLGEVEGYNEGEYDYNYQEEDVLNEEQGEMTMWQDPFDLPVDNDGVNLGPFDPPSFDDGIGVSTSNYEEGTVEQAQEETVGSNENSAGSASRPVIHPAMIHALNNKVIQGDDGAVSGGSAGLDASSSWDESTSVMTTNPEINQGGSGLDNSVSNLLLTSPIQGENAAVLKNQSQGMVSEEKGADEELALLQAKAGYHIDSTEEGAEINLPGSMNGEFESIPATPGQLPENENNLPDELTEPGDVMYGEEVELLEGNVTGAGKEASTEEDGGERVNPIEEASIVSPDDEQPVPNEVVIGNEMQRVEDLDNKADGYQGEGFGGNQDEVLLSANLDEVLLSGPNESVGEEEQYAEEGVSQNKFESNYTRESVIDLQIEATEKPLPLEVHEEDHDETQQFDHEKAEEETQQLEEAEDEQLDFEPTAAEHEDEGNDENDSGDFKGFDEDFSSGHIDISQHESPPDATESQGTSNLQINNGEYSGDGFTYHVLQPKSQGHGSSNSIYTTTAIASLLGILLCFCCIRYKRCRYGRYIKPNRGKYSAVGAEDFFNGTFSDDISFNGKDSDDDMSFSSDDGDGVRIELGRIHEMDANGGLTLEEING